MTAVAPVASADVLGFPISLLDKDIGPLAKALHPSAGFGHYIHPDPGVHPLFPPDMGKSMRRWSFEAASYGNMVSLPLPIERTARGEDGWLRVTRSLSG